MTSPRSSSPTGTPPISSTPDRARAAGGRGGRRRECPGLCRRRCRTACACSRTPAAVRSRRTSTSASPRRPATGGERQPRCHAGPGRGRRAERLRRVAAALRARRPAASVARRRLATVSPSLPHRARNDRPAHAAAPAAPAARAPARALPPRRAPDRAGAGGLDARRLPPHATRDARGDRRLGRGLPPLRGGHRPLLPRHERRAGSAGTCRRPSCATPTRRSSTSDFSRATPSGTRAAWPGSSGNTPSSFSRLVGPDLSGPAPGLTNRRSRSRRER